MLLPPLHQQIPGILDDNSGGGGTCRDAWITPMAAFDKRLKHDSKPKPENVPSTLQVDAPNQEPQDAGKRKARDAELIHVRTMGAARLGMHEAEEQPQLDDFPPEPTLCGQILYELFNDAEGGTKMVPRMADASVRERSALNRIVQSLTFRLTCFVFILINAVFAGVRMDSDLRKNLQRIQGGPTDSDNTLYYIEIGFVAWFSLELLLRIIAEGRGFVIGENKIYNLMDSVLILLSIADMFVPRLASFSFLRIFRAFRIVRIARLVQSISALKPLRTMLFAMVNSFTALLWAFFMITLTMFVFSIFVGSAVLALFETIDASKPGQVEKAENLAPYFGNLYLTMVTLFASITGGDDWMTAATQLRALDAGEFYFVVFCFFVFFSLVGLLNVVNGIFVDSAVCTRTEDEVVQHFRDDEHRTSEEIRRIFQQADKNGSNSITLEELQTQVKHPWVKAYFAGLDIDPREASIIFTLLDTDSNGELTIDEFVAGILKMKGSAKGVDVLAIMFDHQRLALSFNVLCSYLEDELREIKDAVKPGSCRQDGKPLANALMELDRKGAKYIDAYDRKEQARSSPLSSIMPES
eukprot:TRINITY_DN5141_c0_g1_i1.p1 TRINITY_DN5141_c0_g1~~TRINITY_DN5141_c0_g1_i1.p1  ORF type:complete len:582 (+),score=124.71 TRINITY_DN5141_c0_g1_i1:175-1920(+)